MADWQEPCVRNKNPLFLPDTGTGSLSFGHKDGFSLSQQWGELRWSAVFKRLASWHADAGFCSSTVLVSDRKSSALLCPKEIEPVLVSEGMEENPFLC